MIYQEPIRADFWQLFREPGGSYLDPMGPLNCTPHSMARAIMRHYEGQRPPGITGVWPPDGYSIRRYTGDTSGGTTLAQMASVGSTRYGMSLAVRYRLPWTDFLSMLEETRGAILQLWYRRIRDSPYAGSYTFYENHAIFVGGYDRERGVLTGVIDPLADGRQGLFRGPADYPATLLRAAAGELNVASSGYRAVGYGQVYAGFTRPTYGAPVPAPAPSLINYGLTPMNILDRNAIDAYLAAKAQGRMRIMTLPKGTPVYRSPTARDSNILDRMGGTYGVMMTGFPADGWRTVVVSSRNFADGIRRDVEAYVRKSAGAITG